MREVGAGDIDFFIVFYSKIWQLSENCVILKPKKNRCGDRRIDWDDTDDEIPGE